MERKSRMADWLLAAAIILVIIQSWVVITQSKHIVSHLDNIASGKIFIRDGKVYDGDGNEIQPVVTAKNETTEAGTGDEPAESLSFVDVQEMMEKAQAFKLKVGRVGGTFAYAVLHDPKTFNLILNREATTSDLLRYTYDPLIRQNYITGEWEGALAKDWQMSDDGLQCVVHLRDDVVFFDGVRMTADDVVFTYNDLLGNKDIDVGSKEALIFRDWDSETESMKEAKMTVEKVDDYTVLFKFPWRTYSSVGKLEQMVYPKHVLEKYVLNGTFNTTWDVSTDPKEIIGTGPWRPVEYRSGERFVVERNPKYWQKDATGQTLPYLEKIVFSIVPDHSHQLSKFQAGEIDFVSLLGDDVPVLLADKQNKGKDYEVFGAGPNTAVSYMCFNLNHGKDPDSGKPYVEPYKLKWFTNLQFRKAIACCLDKRTWINNYMNGFGVPLWSPLSPAATEFYNPDVVTYPFDLEKAGEMLDGIGYTDRDNDGVREDPDGNPIEFTILTAANNEKALRPITMFISDLDRVGIKANYVIQQTNTFYDSLWLTHDFECTFIGELAGFEVGGIKGLFTSWSSYRFYKPCYTDSGEPIPANIKAKEPWEAELDKLFGDYEKELDTEKRKIIGYEIQRLLSDKIPVIYTVVGERIYAIQNGYENLNPTVRFYPVIWPMMEYLYKAR